MTVNAHGTWDSKQPRTLLGSLVAIENLPLLESCDFPEPCEATCNQTASSAAFRSWVTNSER
ncbi:hypothetical protein BU24DRAFT_419811 [Aaosphaeria arxii CBS 175.79]|uniref:Uncharacterized protein n=1 Tax=Aaosphaeria arxii CBS 175.79 TaxID=1450172 RepID=A0A6A5Y4T4_9PLEO|nr:uncharacterized protein BU24DRAFT_419811 [Aaosphaeria arxii CBS 175.79]KAF2020266.1 hypothetical protein BU24DRAFT_419811 [Aaosphaeria arxii CBS 175.79]